MLSLGLKRETADCGHFYEREEYDEDHYWEIRFVGEGWESYWDVTDEQIPAWSLHRLIEMMPQIIGHFELAVNDAFVGYYEDRCESEIGRDLQLFPEEPFYREEYDMWYYWKVWTPSSHILSEGSLIDPSLFPEVTFENSLMEVELVIKK